MAGGGNEIYFYRFLVCSQTVFAEVVIKQFGSPPKSGSSGVPGKKQSSVPDAYVPLVKKAPVLDGLLTDKTWQNAYKFKLMSSLDGNSTPSQDTEIFLLRDVNNLYIGVKCTEPFVKKIKSPTRSHDGSIWADDSIEIFLGEQGKSTYYQFSANAVGSTYDGKVKQGSWNSGFKVEAKKQNGFWVQEWTVPLKNNHRKNGSSSKISC